MSQHDPYFERLDDTIELEQPSSLVSDSDSLAREAQATFALKPRRLRFIKALVYTLLLLLVVTGGREYYQTFQFLLSVHWTLAALLATAGLVGLALFVGVASQLKSNRHDLNLVADFRKRAEVLVSERSYGQFSSYATVLNNFYAGKPQSPMLKQCLAKMPDYNNDAEAIDYLSTAFLTKLDQAAVRCIARHSEQTALMVAVSPLILIDMLLALWRSARMLDEISQIYGVRPSLLGRWQLMKEVLQLVAFAGASELVSDHLVELSTSELLTKLSTRVAQGVGAGLYTARIGYKAMDVCRPVQLDVEQRPKVTAELGQILKVFKRHGLAAGAAQ